LVTHTATTTGKFANGRGELGAATEIALFVDMDCDGKWSTGDVGLDSTGTRYLTGALQYAPLDDYSTIAWSDTIRIAPGSVTALVLEWHILETASNEIQGDSVSFDIRFTLEQAR
jgi:hypothetical protein